jgi:hypothetical protein
MSISVKWTPPVLHPNWHVSVTSIILTDDENGVLRQQKVVAIPSDATPDQIRALMGFYRYYFAVQNPLYDDEILSLPLDIK